MTIKRIVDITVSTLLLLLLSPLMLVVSVAIAITMGAPVIFRQKRPGWLGREFDVLKFRTMNDHWGSDGEELPDYRRETSFGRFLRDTSIDELPQLINVLRGDMSLVGPRPLMRHFVENCTPRQLRRFEVRPGITGLAQVRGRKALEYDKRFALDVWYVDNQSLLLDMKILFATLPIVFYKDGTVELGDVVVPAEQVHPISIKASPLEPATVFDAVQASNPPF